MATETAEAATTTETATSSSIVASGKRKGKEKWMNHLHITEATRIKLAQVLEQFLASNAEVYKFEENLTNRERAAVHILCRKMGMKSKSSGRGVHRRVSVYKKKKKAETSKGKETLDSFTFSQESKGVLQDLFARYPPDEGEMGEYTIDNANNKVRGKKDDIFSRPSMSKSEITKKVESFAERVEKSPNLRQMMEERSKLPIASFKDTIISTVESHQVVLISGETGCGKTTQVPQFLLDYMWTKGGTCKIVCTQPRRISATSVSERISTERGENVGDTVGYKIRLESNGGRHSSIIFCTNGILLRVLVSRGKGRSDKETSRKMVKDELADITHIIVDEIHERDRYSDFLLAIIRDVLPSYPHLRLILMSATLDAERFSNYFGGCPIIRVPGFTYPVKTFYLEDVLSIVKSPNNNHLDSNTASVTNEGTVLTEEYRTALDEAINLALASDEFDPLLDLISSEGGSEVFNYQHSSTGVTSLMVFAAKGRVGDICMLLSLGADCNIQANDGSIALNWAERENQEEAAEIIKKHMDRASANSQEKQQLLEKYMSNFDPELIDYVLIEKLLRRICIDSEDGAVLIFLPGWDDIMRTRERLQSSSFFKDPSKFLVISLHSMVPAVEQKKVFKRPPPGCRKIILSTNIAETAVTIDDVVYVIDSGRMKEKSYDPYNNVSTLQSSWISKASAKQREGRAGRCQPGICYHLFSKLRAASLPDFQVPEIKRIPIEELCLQVKLLDPDCKIEDFLQKTLDPPVYETIRNAIIVLQDLGALSLDEKLTELGAKLGSLPVHPLTSKMLLIAILLNCLDPALTLACASDYRDPFALPMLPNDKKRAAAAKSQLASLYGGNGDQLAVVAAFDCWRKAKEKGQEAQFCSEYFVSSSTMNMISRMRKQLQSELQRIGFIPVDASRSSLNAQDAGILHAVLVAGLYPMVGRLLPPLKGGRRAVIETSGGDKVRLHTYSTNFKLSFRKFENRPLIIYDEITRGDGGLHIRNCSVVGPLPLLLLATEIVVAPANDNDDDEDEGNDGSDYDETDDDGDCDEDKMETNDASEVRRGEKIMSSPDKTVKVIIDRWLPYESTALDVAEIYCLRERLSAAILFKVKHPGKVLPEVLGASVFAIACILSYDGMSGISLPSEPVDSLTTMVSATEIGQSDVGKRRGRNQNPGSFLESLMPHDKHQKSTSNYQKGISQPPKVMNNWNNSGHYRGQIPLASVGTTPNQNPPLHSSSVPGHGAAVHTATVPRREYPKRQRGN